MTLRAWWARVRGSLRRSDAVEREMDREMEFHVDMSTRRNVERGMTPEAARRQARQTFGSVETFKEQAREAYRARLAEDLVSDARFALRGLRRRPSFAVAAVLTTALGIGASTAIFAVVNAMLLRPLPIPQPEDFTYVGWVWRKGGEIPALTAFQYEFVRDHGRGFQAVASYRTQEAYLGDPSAAQWVRGLRVSGGFFRTLGFTPRLGRAFDARELKEGSPSVVILGDNVWRARFGADPAVLGRQVRLDGQARTVVGVLGPKFRFPPAAENTGFLVPFAVRGDPDDEGHNTDVIARLRHGLSEGERTADLQALTGAFRAAYPSLASAGESFRLLTYADVSVGSVHRRLLWVLFGAVLLVLLIACANTATLLLVRASTRQREMAVRVSLGARPARILQQVLVEGLVLSAMGAAFGVLFSIVAVRAFLAAAPTALPAGSNPGIDLRVLIYTGAVSIVTGLAFGLAAAGPAYRTRLQPALASARATAVGGTRIREALVFLETTAAVVLLSGAVLLAASFARLIGVDPGFDANHVVAVRLGRLPPEYDAERRKLLIDGLLERVRGLPGVENAALAPNLPLERGLNFPIDIPERPDLGIGAVELRFVSPRYFATLAIPLRSGRDFDAGDVAGAEPVAIVNEAFARHFWNGAPPVGRTIQLGHYKGRWLIPGLEHQTRVIGVAADIHESALDRAAKPTVLLPRAQIGEGIPLLLVRGSSPSLPGRLRDAVVAAEPQLTPQVERLSAVVSRSVAEPRFRTLLVGAFAGFALLLAAIGIYGVIAAVVQQRQREIGLRLALGADRATILVAVVRRCLANVAAGALVGLFVFWATRHVLSSMVYDISPGDPRVLAAAVALLASVAALASWVPARRATRIDPAASLRLE